MNSLPKHSTKLSQQGPTKVPHLSKTYLLKKYLEKKAPNISSKSSFSLGFPGLPFKGGRGGFGDEVVITFSLNPGDAGLGTRHDVKRFFGHMSHMSKDQCLQ